MSGEVLLVGGPRDGDRVTAENKTPMLCVRDPRKAATFTLFDYSMPMGPIPIPYSYYIGTRLTQDLMFYRHESISAPEAARLLLSQYRKL